MIRNHIRSNVVGYVTVFIAMSGVAYAVDGPLPGTNQVGSEDIINGEVYSADVRNGQISSADVADDRTARALTGDDIAQESLTGADVTDLGSADVTDGSLTGADVLNQSLTGSDISDNSVNSDDVFGLNSGDINNDAIRSSHVLNQSLTGSDISDNTVNSDDVFGLRSEDINDDELTGTDIDESTLNVQQKVRWARVNAAGTIDAQSGGISAVVTGNEGAGRYTLNFGSDMRNHALHVTGNSFTSAITIAFVCGPDGGTNCNPSSANNVNHVEVWTFEADGTSEAGAFFVSAIPR